MFNLPKYSKYERPEGHSSDSPLVLVRKNVIRDLGMPSVDYGGLEELFYKDLGYPTNRRPKAKLYGGSIGKRAMRAFFGQTVSPDLGPLGFHVAYTNTLHVNASAAERNGEGTMKVFVHEAQHVADSRNFPLARAIELGIGAAVMKLGIEAADATDIVPEVAGALIAREVWYAAQPAERRARATQDSEIFFKHSKDIIFPPK